MSIARPCPYSDYKEECKYEKRWFHPTFDKCSTCKRFLRKNLPDIDTSKHNIDGSGNILKASKMMPKRVILESIANFGSCRYLHCEECPYDSKRCHERFLKIAAMALLRMFPKKKRPTLSVGTKIKFDDGRVAKIVGECNKFLLEFSNYSYPLSYLIGTTWEIVNSDGVKDEN